MLRAWLPRTIFVGAMCLLTGCGPAIPATPAARSTNSAIPAMTTSMSSSVASNSPPGSTAAVNSEGTSPPASTQQPRPAPPASTAASPTPSPSTAPPASGRVPTSTALALLDDLPVKGRASLTGYTRAQFGDAWTDDNTAPGGHNGCDTRNDILRRDLVNVVIKADSNGCTVLSGTVHDAYTATTIVFIRGVTTSTAVQIDHLVALGDAWQTGAQQLTTAERTDLANDPQNLQAVDGPTNEAKGDSDAASWLPPNKSYRCTYLTRQIQVKTSYHLWVTAAEKTVMQQQLSHCPAGSTATTGPRTVPSTTHRTSALEPTEPVTTAPPGPPATTRAVPATTPPGDVYYQDCAAMRAAGKAPLNAGQPGYRAGLDRDHDGIACES